VDFYLVRHGEAVSHAVDPLRPLTVAGRHDVEQVARMAATRKVQVAAIYHSGILRAKQTAEILGAHLSPAAGVREMSGLRPQDDPMIAKAELEVARDPLMLVGHLPHMSCLAGLLVSGDQNVEVVAFVPATLVCCSTNGRRWHVAWVLTPQPN